MGTLVSSANRVAVDFKNVMNFNLVGNPRLQRRGRELFPVSSVRTLP